MPPRRVVLHVDMDAFFASVAQHDDPSLAGRPVLVGGASSQRGVVAAASYEARAYGVRSAMPMAEALARCPHAVVVPAAPGRYREVHAQLRAVWERYAPAVEVASFDEAYLDLTGCEALLGPAPAVAAAIKRDVRALTGLTCSVGVGSSKLVAKVASRRQKPDGLCVVSDGSEASWLAPLAVSELPGVGPKTAAKLAELGVQRVAQLLEMPEALLVRHCGSLAPSLRQMARGLDARPVTPEREARSMGAETTFASDVGARTRLRATIYDLVAEVAFRLRSARLLAGHITLKVRYGNFETFTRGCVLGSASDDDDALAAAALALLEAHVDPGRPVRLLGVTAEKLSSVAQLSWLAPAETAERKALNQALDALRERHGLWVVSRGSHLEANVRRP